ncbi:MAG: prefoldin subunit beta [Candidatus Aenigmatarchaeota archaeon]|nr:MAG: prefoldin subunit beta [Candidatus Aenigmarchaeota archaeon]
MTDDVQQLIAQAQSYQQQFQSIITQRETLKLQQLEIKKALEELEKTNEDTVYKISGPILIKTSKSDVKKELTEKSELISARLRTLEKSERLVKEKIEELRRKLEGGSEAGG